MLEEDLTSPICKRGFLFRNNLGIRIPRERPKIGFDLGR